MYDPKFFILSLAPKYHLIVLLIISILLLLKVLADPRNAEEDGRVWSIMFIALAVMSAIAGFLRSFCFSVSGEALTARLRSMSFKAIMRQVGKRNQHYTCVQLI